MKAAWMNKQELASYLGISDRTVDRWRQYRYLPEPRYISGRPRWNIQEVDAWMDKLPTKHPNGKVA